MRSNALLWTLKQIRNRIPGILVMTAAQVGHSVFCVLFALGSRAVIDSATAGDARAFGMACLKQAAIIAGILLSLTLVRHIRERLRADLDRDWKKKLLHGLLNGDYAQVSAYHSAELLNRLNNDVTKVNEGLLNIIPNGGAMAARIIAVVAVLGSLDIRFALVMAVLGTIVVATTAVLRRRLKELNRQVSEHDGKVSGFLQETMEKLLMVQAMDISREMERRTGLLLDDRYEVQRKRKNVSVMSNTAVSVMHYGAGFLALCWCAGRLLRGQMSFGSLTAVIQLVNQLQAPFVNLSGILPQYAAMAASAERLMELDAVRGEPVPQGDVRSLYEKMQTIRGENLCFSYDRDRILQNAGFTLEKGTFAVITGPSGIGKSTILKLILGVFHPDSGELYLDTGAERIPLDRRTRNLFAYVPQGNLLLSGTLRENLTVVRPDCTEEDLQQAVYVSCMDEFLPGLPQGLDTVLGESGAGLSEGQAQRLAIARAVLGGAPVLLLDECTSALDIQTERTVLHRLRGLPGRTCISVTHHPGAMEICDRRLEMRDGIIWTMKQNGS